LKREKPGGTLARVSSPPVLGIDLGTTMSVAAVYRDGQVTFIENELGDSLTPSVVAYDERARGLVVGRVAKDILALHPDRAVAMFKRSMGRDIRFQLGSASYTPVELSAYVLDALRTSAEHQLEQKLTRCVITVPAYFGEDQRHATKQAAQLVGFHVERVLNEPTAAAIAYGLHAHDTESQFVVMDLGGGTFDVCVMELFEGLLEVKSVAGESQLGGEDFTLALRDLVLHKAGLTLAELDLRAQVTMLKRAELLKRSLSRWARAEIRVCKEREHELCTLGITQEEADIAYRPLLDRMIKPCRAALRSAGLTPDELDDVVLVGGATRMPSLRAFVHETFGKEPRVAEDPDHTVARGAAIQAALAGADASVQDIVVTDVASHSLGVSLAKLVNEKLVDGFFSPIIERNTVIPTSRSNTFSTVRPNQSSIRVRVFEGEARRADENRALGEFEVSGIPKGPPRDAIDVRFTYDLSGILEVEATVLETGSAHARLFQRGKQQLSDAQLASAREQIARLKANPRERPRHRELLSRASTLWSELTGGPREELGFLIDQFDAALDARTPGDIDRCFEALARACEGHDQGARW
jgi:molecular chaperone HscC